MVVLVGFLQIRQKNCVNQEISKFAVLNLLLKFELHDFII